MNKRYLLEGLERRALLSAVSWDGGGDGVNWADPLNWSNDALPTISDDVTINVAANPTILVTGSRSVNSLSNSETLDLKSGNSTQHGILSVEASSSNSGTIILDSDSTFGYTSMLFVNGGTFTNSGSVQAAYDPSFPSGQRTISLSGGGAATFVNSGTLSVADNATLSITGNSATGVNADTFQQAGTVTVGANAALNVDTVLLHYTGGSNTSGMVVRNSALDLDAATSASNLVAQGSNTLIGQDAANLSLIVQGTNTNQHGILNVNSSVTTTGPIVLDSSSSFGYTALLFVNAGTFTNNSTITITSDPNFPSGIRNIDLSSAPAGTSFVNGGTINVLAGAHFTIRGSSNANGPLQNFQQSGSFILGTGADATVDTLNLQYTAGSNSDGLTVRNATINLTGATSPSNLIALGSNTLLGHATANITLIVRGTNTNQTGILNVNSTMTTTGPIQLDSDSSFGYTAMLMINAGTYTNSGTIRVGIDPSFPSQQTRNIQMSGNDASATFINAGTIQVDATSNLSIRGTTTSGADADTFQQAGTITIGAGASATVDTVIFQYNSGSNTDGLLVRNSAIELNGSTGASTVTAISTNSLLGHTAPNLTLRLLGTDSNQYSTLQINSNAISSGLIVMDANSTAGYASIINVDNGTFTNQGTILVMPVFGTHQITVNNNPPDHVGTFLNQGTIQLIGTAKLNGSGAVTNVGTIEKNDAGEATFGAGLVNTGTGLVDISAGTLRFTGTTNIGDGAFLTGGRYHVASGATLGFGTSVGQRPTINTADIEISGTGVAEIDTLVTNRGRIALLDGNDLSVVPMSGGLFSNEGILDLSADSIFSVTGNMNFAGTSQPVIHSEIASATSFGTVVVSGAFDLNSPASTSRFDPDLVNGYDPALNTTFDVITANPISNGFDSFQGGLTPSNNVLELVRPSVNVVQVKIGPGPLPPAPQILNETYDYETRQAVVFTFDQDVSAFLSRKDYLLENLTTSQTVPSSAGILSYNQASNQATLTLTNQLADGNYSLTVSAGDIANSAGVPASGAPIVLDFFVLLGDADHDRHVNVSDLGDLATNFGETTGATLLQGDFDYNGAVNVADLGDLATNFGQSLAAGTAAPAAVASPHAIAPLQTTNSTVSSSVSPFSDIEVRLRDREQQLLEAVSLD